MNLFQYWFIYLLLVKLALIEFKSDWLRELGIGDFILLALLLDLFPVFSCFVYSPEKDS